MPADAEEVQKMGLDGVTEIKRWLEATTHLELPFDVYHHPEECTIPYMGGKRKKLDLFGWYLTGNKEPIHVECKAYSGDSGQYQDFQHLLGIAYSAALRDPEIWGKVRPRHYYWVTYHPFALGRWKDLETRNEMAAALELHPQYLANSAVDEGLIREVSSRVTVLVYNRKMDALTLTRDELQRIYPVIERKGESV